MTHVSRWIALTIVMTKGNAGRANVCVGEATMARPVKSSTVPISAVAMGCVITSREDVSVILVSRAKCVKYPLVLINAVDMDNV